jgi:hypothetical protein
MTAPQDPYSYPGAPGTPPARAGAQTFSIIAIVCGIIAILFLPILFGPAGIILAIVANRRGEPLWKVALGVAIGGMVLGFILGAVVLGANN